MRTVTLRRAWAGIEAIGTAAWLLPIAYGALRWFSVIGGPNILTIILIFIGLVGLSLSVMSKRRKKRPRYGDPRKRDTASQDPARDRSPLVEIGHRAVAIGTQGDELSDTHGSGIHTEVDATGTRTYIGHLHIGRLGPSTKKS